MKRLNITDDVLDRLGFSEYCDEDATWGGRTLTFTDGTMFRIAEQEEVNPIDGDALIGRYVSHHFYFTGWFAIPKTDARHYDLFFLHEMYECIENEYPFCLDEFVNICSKCIMQVYIEEYLSERKIN